MANKVSRSDRTIVYALIQQAIDDARLHIQTATSLIDEPDTLESAIHRNKRAVDAIEESEKAIQEADDEGLITKKKKTTFEKELAQVRQLLWRLSCRINKAAKKVHPLRVQSRDLRRKFLAYSYEPKENAEAVGG
jgi:chromosome segregation ATPase